MTDDLATARTILRLLRKQGLHCTLAVEAGQPVLRVGPAALLAQHAYLRAAVVRLKPALITVLEAERRHGRCPTCGAGDWGPTTATVELRDGPRQVWACLTCTTTVEELEAEVAGETPWQEPIRQASTLANQGDQHSCGK